jgi:hypothetical protein
MERPLTLLTLGLFLLATQNLKQNLLKLLNPHCSYPQLLKFSIHVGTPSINPFPLLEDDLQKHLALNIRCTMSCPLDSVKIRQAPTIFYFLHYSSVSGLLSETLSMAQPHLPLSDITQEFWPFCKPPFKVLHGPPPSPLMSSLTPQRSQAQKMFPDLGRFPLRSSSQYNSYQLSTVSSSVSLNIH